MRVKQKTAAPPGSLSWSRTLKNWTLLNVWNDWSQSKTKTRCSVGWNAKSRERLERLKPPNPYGSMTSFRCGSWAKEHPNLQIA